MNKPYPYNRFVMIPPRTMKQLLIMRNDVLMVVCPCCGDEEVPGAHSIEIIPGLVMVKPCYTCEATGKIPGVSLN